MDQIAQLLMCLKLGPDHYAKDILFNTKLAVNGLDLTTHRFLFTPLILEIF